MKLRLRSEANVSRQPTMGALALRGKRAALRSQLCKLQDQERRVTTLSRQGRSAKGHANGYGKAMQGAIATAQEFPDAARCHSLHAT